MKKQTVYIETSVEDELPTQATFVYNEREAYYSTIWRDSEFDCLIAHTHESYFKPTHWLKEKKEAYVFTEPELLEYIKKKCGEAFEAGEIVGCDPYCGDSTIPKEAFLNNIKLD